MKACFRDGEAVKRKRRISVGALIRLALRIPSRNNERLGCRVNTHNVVPTYNRGNMNHQGRGGSLLGGGEYSMGGQMEWVKTGSTSGVVHQCCLCIETQHKIGPMFENGYQSLVSEASIADNVAPIRTRFHSGQFVSQEPNPL